MYQYEHSYFNFFSNYCIKTELETELIYINRIKNKSTNNRISYKKNHNNTPSSSFKKLDLILC